MRICLETMAKMRVQAMMRSDAWDYTKWQQTLFQGQSIEELAADARVTAARIRREGAKALSATR